MSSDDAQSSANDPLGERVYQAVKAYVTSVARPGQRLDLAFLASRQRASLTPVRAALHRLTGEGLVEAYLNAGFRVSPVTLGGLQDLYTWNRLLLAEALAAPLRPESGLAAGFELPLELVVVRDVANLFREVVHRLGNAEATRAIEGVNDRLHRVRMFELSVLGDGVAELRLMARLLSGDERAGLGEAIKYYHDRRLKVSGAILNAAAKSGQT